MRAAAVGSLARHDVGSLMRRHGCVGFVETGTGAGDGLAAASLHPFAWLRSCEKVPALADRARERFAADSRVAVLCMNSLGFLSLVLDAKRRCDEPILFWLDAHFPGADYGLAAYGDEANESVRLPLWSELEAIRLMRPGARDVVLIDDLRVYEEGPFGAGPLPADVRPACPVSRSAGFVDDMFSRTHLVRRDYSDEGYLLLTPRVAA